MSKTNKPLDVLEEYGLNLNQEMFCQYFTSPSEFYGNGVQSYAAAYNIDITDRLQYNVAKTRASQLLSNINICNRINDLLDLNGFNDNNVDKQLMLVIQQSADLRAKIAGIKEYNKLKGRITDKLEHVFNAPVAVIEIVPVPPKRLSGDDVKVVDDKPAEKVENTQHEKQQSASAQTSRGESVKA